MKNITLSLDDQVLASVRLYAAERNATVNGLVREFLTGIARREGRARRARKRMRELSRTSSGRLGSRSWTRDELHGR